MILHSLNLACPTWYILLLIISGRQLRAARAMLGMEQIELAKRAQVGVGTIRRMEAFDGAIVSRTDTLGNVMSALEKAGIEFLDHERPGVRLRSPVK